MGVYACDKYSWWIYSTSSQCITVCLWLLCAINAMMSNVNCFMSLRHDWRLLVVMHKLSLVMDPMYKVWRRQQLISRRTMNLRFIHHILHHPNGGLVDLARVRLIVSWWLVLSFMARTMDHILSVSKSEVLRIIDHCLVLLLVTLDPSWDTTAMTMASSSLIISVCRIFLFLPSFLKSNLALVNTSNHPMQDFPMVLWSLFEQTLLQVTYRQSEDPMGTSVLIFCLQ